MLSIGRRTKLIFCPECIYTDSRNSPITRPAKTRNLRRLKHRACMLSYRK